MQKKMKRILTLLLTLALIFGLVPTVGVVSAATESTEEASDMLAKAAYAWSSQDWTGAGQLSYSNNSTVTNGTDSLRSWKFSTTAKAGGTYARLQIDLKQNYDMSNKDLVFDVKADPAKDLTGYSVGVVPYGSDWKPLHDFNYYQEYLVHFKGDGWNTVTVDNSILKAYLETGKDLSSVRVLYLSFNFPGDVAQNIYIDNMRLVDHNYGTDITDADSDLLANATIVSNSANGTTYTYEHANKMVAYGNESNASHKFAAAANAADMLTVKYDLGKSYDLTNKNFVLDMLSYRGGNGFAFSLYNSKNQLVSYSESYTTVNEWAQVRPAILAGLQSGKNLSDVRYIAIGARFATNTSRSDRAFYVDNVRIEGIDTYSTPLQHKNIVFMGDSITAAYGYKGWSGELEEHYLINKYNLGVGGASFATIDGRTAIYAQKDKIPNVDVDFFVLNGGVNDVWSKSELGAVSDVSVASATVNSFDTNTTAGAMEQMFCYLRKTYPNAKLGFVINYIIYTSSWDGVAFRDEFVPLAKAVCEKWGVSCLDMSVDTSINALYGVHTYDGVHGNDVGYELVARKMAPWLIGLCDANEQSEQNSDLLAYATYSWSAYTWNKGALSYDYASNDVSGSESTRSWKFSATSAQTENAGMQLKLNNLDVFTLTGKKLQFDAKFEASNGNPTQKIGLRLYDKNWKSVTDAKTVWAEGNGTAGWQTITIDAEQFASILVPGCNLDDIRLIAFEFDFATNKGNNQSVYLDNFRVISVTATDTTEQASDLLYGAGFVEGSMKSAGLGYDQFNTTFLNGADSKYSLRLFAEDDKTAWGTATFILPQSIDLRNSTLQFDVNQYNQVALWVDLYDSDYNHITGDNYTLREIGWQTYEINALFGLKNGTTAEDLQDIRYIKFSLNLDPANIGRCVVIDNLTTYKNAQYDSSISGMTGLYLGDSIAEAHNYKGWHGEMAEHYGVNGYNVSTGGRTLGNNGIYKELADVPENVDFDFILLDGGVNDLWSPAVVGEVTAEGTTSFDDATIIGSLEKLFYTFDTRYPDAEVIFVIAYMHTWNFEKDTYLNEFIPRVKQACEKWGVHCLDLVNNAPFLEEFDPTSGVHTYDGLHANKEGYDIITPYVVEFLEDVFNADAAGNYMVLQKDETVDLSLIEDLYVDLNGFDLTGTIETNGFKVYGIDSTTDRYTCDKMGYFSCVDVNGEAVVPVSQFRSYKSSSVKRYVTIETENGYTFHRFYMGITKQSLRPSVTGVGYKAVFYGDDMVKSVMDENNAYGYSLRLEGFNDVTATKARDAFVSGEELTLRVQNFDAQNYGQTNLYAAVWVKLNGELITSTECSMTLRQLVETINEKYKSFTDTQLQAIRDMIAANPIMESWQIQNIMIQEVLRGEEFTAGKDNFYTFTAGDYKSLSFDYKTKDDGELAVILRGSQWTSFYGDFRLTESGEKTDYAGITTEVLEDGYIRVTFDIEALQRTGCVNNRDSAPADIALIDIYNWTTVDGYIDNIQVSMDAPKPETRGEAFTAGKDNFYYLDEAAAYDYLSFDYKTVGDGEVAVIIRGSKWSTFYGDFRLNATGEKTDYPGITTEMLDDGYVRVTFDLAALQRTGCVNNRDTAPVDVKLIDIYNWTTVGGYIDNIQATFKAPVATNRGETFTANKDTHFYLEQPGNWDLISFDYKTESAGEVTAILRGSAWGSTYYGEYRFTESGELVDYAGVTTEQLDDGYIRVTFDVAALNRTGCLNDLNNAPADIALIDIYNWTTVGGYIDNIQAKMKDSKPEDSDIPPVPIETTSFAAGSGTWIKTATAYDSITFDYKLDGDGVMGLILRDDQNWLTYYGGYYFNAKGENIDYAGITTEELGNGYIRVTLIFDDLTVTSPNGAPANVEIFDVYGSYTTVNGAFGNVTLDAAIKEEPEGPEEIEKPAKPGNGELVTVTFADVQLMTEHRGNTVNGPKALLDHLNYAKSINADVLFMPGDIVNNAVQGYYDRFWTIFKSVYGQNESQWPEIIWTMGNHEWYDANEKNASNAIALFKANARIESDNLVRISKVASEANPGQTVANYYKVVNGVPFVVISGDSISNKVSEAQKAELIGWLDEIMELPTVKAGTPIYVAYHLPIADVTYFGQGASDVSKVVDDILKNYPNTIVFTGDTHCPGVNERTINQIDYTSINLGSSSYSRIVKRSATSQEEDKYYNVGGNAKDVVTGEVAFGFTYTPNLMVLQNNTDGSVMMDRYVTDTNPQDVRKVGITWNFPSGLTKDKFIYTNDRFENKEWANILYGKDGLIFAEDASISFSVDGTEMIVYFDDVTDHNYAEHYKITITADGTTAKTYDVVGNYFKYYEEAETYHLQLSDIPAGTSYTVEVKAYDFFDNESLNSIVATTESATSLFPDKIETAVSNTYTDISTRVNFEDTAGSVSSLECYYRGDYLYTYGATLGTVLEKNNLSVADAFTVTDWSHGVLTLKVKNAGNVAINVGLTVVVTENGADKWITDFGGEYRKVVQANGEWVELSWDLNEQFGIDELTDVSAIRIKANSTAPSTNGYTMHLYVDDIDIVQGDNADTEEPGLVVRGKAFSAGVDNFFYLDEAGDYETLTFDYKTDGSGEIAVIFRGSKWSTFYGDFRLTENGEKVDYAGITTAVLEDGYIRVTFNLKELQRSGCVDNRNAAPVDVKLIDLYNWTTVNGYIDNITVS